MMIYKLNRVIGNSRKTRIRRVVLCTIAICSFAIYVFLPEVISGGWHILNGTSINLGEWQIPVPWAYWVIKGKDAIVLQRPARWISSEKSASDLVIRKLQLPVGAEFDSMKWKNASINDSLESQYHYMSDRTVELDNESGTCVTFVDINHPESLNIHCIFPIHRLDIQYMGTRAHADGLDFLVNNIRPTK